MKLATIGVGNAGSKIVDRMVGFEQQTGRTLCTDAIAVNTARTDLAKPDYIPEHRRVLIGETHQDAKGHGVGGDVDLGREVAERDIDEVLRSLDDIAIHDVDGLLVCAGLGGGTGSGGGPVVLKHLQEMYAEPVYALTILPGAHEGGRPAMNASRSFNSFARLADNAIVFDNDAWRESGQSVAGGYQETNQEIATRIVTLLAAGETDTSTVSENAMDSSDIIRTLDTGGVSSIAYAATDVKTSAAPKKGLLSRFTNGNNQNGEHDYGSGATVVDSLVRRAVNSRLTLPCEISSAERVVIVVSGPEDKISRKGLESARKWIEEQADTAEVLAGDDPRDTGFLAAAVLLSNVTEAPRVKEMQNQGVEAQQKIDEMAASRDDEIESLITDDAGDLDPVL